MLQKSCQLPARFIDTAAKAVQRGQLTAVLGVHNGTLIFYSSRIDKLRYSPAHKADHTKGTPQSVGSYTILSMHNFFFANYISIDTTLLLIRVCSQTILQYLSNETGL